MKTAEMKIMEAHNKEVRELNALNNATNPQTFEETLRLSKHYLKRAMETFEISHKVKSEEDDSAWECMEEALTNIEAVQFIYGFDSTP